MKRCRTKERHTQDVPSRYDPDRPAGDAVTEILSVLLRKCRDGDCVAGFAMGWWWWERQVRPAVNTSRKSACSLSQIRGTAVLRNSLVTLNLNNAAQEEPEPTPWA
jgi:hypothetical protein